MAIDPKDLAFVERVERDLHAALGPSAVLRCRITHQGVVLELQEDLGTADLQDEAAKLVSDHCAAEARRFMGHRAYRRGAAFLREVGA